MNHRRLGLHKLLLVRGLDGEVVGWESFRKRRLRRIFVLHRDVRDPPTAANELIGFLAALDVGINELIAEQLLLILFRVGTRDETLTNKNGPGVKANNRD